ncbi:hypothetical protein NM208_g6522 [Fusarium decemcellulare]|uniref:Uncharacterized protein n=1 Tax=Fusarium decemcellulare TaxID=57161 RepID=A0ACC1SCN6_9HYPO|nr:hypothetical protein NM208_g6522 [Fusarium decemcellulare]
MQAVQRLTRPGAMRLCPGATPFQRLLSTTRPSSGQDSRVNHWTTKNASPKPLPGSGTDLKATIHTHHAFSSTRSYNTTATAQANVDTRTAANSTPPRVPITIDGKTAEFSAVLLRDACQCPRCVHEFTNQRLFSTADIPADIEARDVNIDADSDTVSIKWAKDAAGFDGEHTTELSVTALRELSQSGALPGLGKDTLLPQALWSQELLNLPDYDYEEYMRDDKALFGLIKQLRTDGLAFVTNVPGTEKSVSAIATRIGPVKDTFYGYTWDVRTVPEAINAAYTSHDLGFHTDLLYFQDPPHVQLLHCVQSASAGGASVFADAYKSAVDLFHSDIEAFETLATVPVNYHYNHPNSNVYRTTKPVIDLRPLRIGNKIYTRVQDYVKDWHDLNIRNGGSGWNDSALVDLMQKINWGPPFLAPFSNHGDMMQEISGQSHLSTLNSKVDRWHQAASEFNALLQRSEYLYERKMNPGDCVLFDNTRTLHSRRAFEMADVGKPRWLRGTYVDKDSYLSKLRVLRNRFGTEFTRRAKKASRERSSSLSSLAETWGCPDHSKSKTAAHKLCFSLGCRHGAQQLIRTFARTQDQANSQGSSKITTGMRTVLDATKVVQNAKTAPNLVPSALEVTTSEQDRRRLLPSTSQAIETNLSRDPQSTEFPDISDVAMNELTDMFIDPNLSWLTEGPSTWEPAEFGTDAHQIDGTAWDSVLDGELLPTSILEYHLSCPSNQGIPKAPVHLSTTLIEHWFRYVCPMRSTFDSEINYNRQLAWSSWGTSEAVFYMMQVMSAACLMTTMPQLRDTLPSLKQQATLATDHAISQVRASLPAKVTADLVFAVFGLGTSSHWIVTTFPAQQPWLESARELLFMWKLNLTPADALIYAYFCQALTYWEMLVAAIGRGSMPVKVDQRRKKYHSRLRNAMNLQTTDSDTMCEVTICSNSGPNTFGTRPNSWCGLSNEVINVFGQVLALCRSVCYRDKRNATLTLETASNALCDISVAHELQRELLAMDFETLVLMEEAQGYHVETQDDKTPLSHLLQTAEAYRQAALLQLYLTFYDLDIKHTDGKDGLASTLPSNAVNGTSRDEKSRAS